MRVRGRWELFVAYVVVNPFLLTFILVACAWFVLRGHAMIRLLLGRPLVLWVVTIGGVAIWASITDAWRSVEWGAVAYFVWVAVVAFTGLAVVGQLYNT